MGAVLLDDDDPERGAFGDRLQDVGRSERVGPRRLVAVDDAPMRHGHAGRREHRLGEVLLHRERGSEHARMRIGYAQDLEQALNRAVLAAHPVQGVEGDVGPELRQRVGDGPVDVDAGDAVADRLEGVGALASRIQRDGALRRPASHQDRDVFHSETIPRRPAKQ